MDKIVFGVLGIIIILLPADALLFPTVFGRQEVMFYSLALCGICLLIVLAVFWRRISLVRITLTDLFVAIYLFTAMLNIAFIADFKIDSSMICKWCALL